MCVSMLRTRMSWLFFTYGFKDVVIEFSALISIFIDIVIYVKIELNNVVVSHLSWK